MNDLPSTPDPLFGRSKPVPRKTITASTPGAAIMQSETVGHTAGPWQACLDVPTAIIPGHIIKTVADPQSPIASLWEGGGTKGKERQIANAKLIAAAPDLLAACKDLLSHASVTEHMSAASVERAEAALAKAIP